VLRCDSESSRVEAAKGRDQRVSNDGEKVGKQGFCEICREWLDGLRGASEGQRWLDDLFKQILSVKFQDQTELMTANDDGR